MTIELQTNVCCIKSSCNCNYESGISDGSELEFLVSITKTWSGYLKVQFRFQTLFHFHRDQIHEDQVVIPQSR
jgi:hypothetical protein